MARTSCVLFNPTLGCKYYIENIETSEKVVAKVLGNNDKKLDSNIRSPKKCERGQEFFKAIYCNIIIKFMNSNIHKECISSCGKWKFTNERYIKNINYNDDEIDILQDETDLKITEKDFHVENQKLMSII